MFFEQQSLNDILTETPELRQNGDWVCINIETNMPWPTKAQSFVFESQTVWVMPYCHETYPGLSLNCGGDLAREDGWALLHRALSMICWMQGGGATVAHMSGGNLPRMMGGRRESGIIITDGFDLTDLPEVPEERAGLALALMREGRGLSHPAFAFLSFFKVLEQAVPHGNERARWITERLDQIEGIQAREALQRLRENVGDEVGRHLFQSGRCAIAHAKSDPIINPDEPLDARRLNREKPIMEALAILAIEERLGVQTTRTIFREHLYELRGWKLVIGDAIINALSAGERPPDVQIDAPILNVRLRRSTPFAPLESMEPHHLGMRDGKIEIVYRSADRLVELTFLLNFAEERLEFDIERGLVCRDDGTAVAARNAKELERFFRDYFGNGELQMWNAETGKLVSRCDAFIPVNCFLDLDAANAAIDRWDPIIERREQAERNPE